MDTILKEIRLKNWKSFEDATLYIDPFTVLIGTNASGKSNILDALVFLQRIADGLDVQTALGGNESLPALRGGVSGAARKSSEQIEISILTEIFNIQLDLSSQNTIENICSIKINFKNFSKDIINWSSNSVFKFDKNIFILDIKSNKIRDYSRYSQNLLPDASNLAGFLIALPKETQQNIEQTLTEYLSQLPERDIKRVWAEPVGRLGSDAMLYCEEEWIDGQTQIIDAHSMSDGTLRFLAILTALLTRPEGSLLAIEEVDNGLHPSRMHLLLKAIREIGARRNLDILVTTHNPALLDNLPPEMMPFVQVVHRDMHTGASKITPLDDIEQLPKLLASGSLGKITTRGELEQSLQAQDAKHD